MNLQWIWLFLANADQKRHDTQHDLLRKTAYILEDVKFTVNLDSQRMGFSGWKASSCLRCFITPKKISPQNESHKDMMIDLARTEIEADPTRQDAYVEDIKPQFLGGDDRGIYVMSMFGMGGLGKTTLAKRLYNDRAVVCVSFPSSRLANYITNIFRHLYFEGVSWTKLHGGFS